MNQFYDGVRFISHLSWQSSQNDYTHHLIVSSSKRVILPLIISALFSLRHVWNIQKLLRWPKVQNVSALQRIVPVVPELCPRYKQNTISGNKNEHLLQIVFLSFARPIGWFINKYFMSFNLIYNKISCGTTDQTGPTCFHWWN